MEGHYPSSSTYSNSISSVHIDHLPACSGSEFKGSTIAVVLAMIVVSCLLGIVLGGSLMLIMRSERFLVKVSTMVMFHNRLRIDNSE